MKKINFLFAFLMLCSVSYAQSPVTFGPKVGYTTSKLRTELKGFEEDFKAGFQAGAFIRINVSKKFYLQPEIYYAIKGGNLDSNSLTQKFKLETLDVPLIVGYKLIGKEAFNFRLFAGPVASFIMDKNIKFKLDGKELSGDKVNNTIKDAIWGVQMGAGFDILIFTFDVRYEIGLNDISSDNYEAKLKSNTFHVSLGWKIL